MLRLAILFAVVAGAPTSAAAQSPQSADSLLARAMELHQAGDLLGAIDNYKAVLAIEPERADALSNLGAAYVRLGQFDDAIQQYSAALKVDPTNTPIRLNLALAYYKSARPQLAIPELKRVVASEPQAKNAYLILADCYLQTGQDKELLALMRPREQMFENDLAYAYLARHGADPHRRSRRRAEICRPRVRSRRISRGAAPDGHGLPGARRLSLARRRSSNVPSSSIRNWRRRSRSTAAPFSRSASRTPPSARSGASSSSMSTTSKPTCRWAIFAATRSVSMTPRRISSGRWRFAPTT